MTSTVYLNGQYLSKDDAHISPDDRGFVFGDGVYEVTRAINGKLFEWKRHARRLQYGLSALGLKPAASIDDIEKISAALLEKNGLLQGEATVYLQITRGAAPRVHPFPPNLPCTVYILANPFSPPHALRKTGVKAITTPDIRWARCDLKTVNLLPAVLAKNAAAEAGAYEAVFVRDGVITEGAYTNIFGVAGGVLRTHPLNNRILGGTKREIVIELARELNLPFKEEPLALTELPQLSELFMTSVGNDILPIIALDNNKVGAGTPGPVAQQLYAALCKRLYGKDMPLAA